LSDSNASSALYWAVEQPPPHLHTQAGDKAQAGSDQRFSAKSSDDDDGGDGARNGHRPAGQGPEKPHHSGAAHVAAVADGAGGAGGGAGEDGAGAPGRAQGRRAQGRAGEKAGQGGREGQAQQGVRQLLIPF